MELRKCPEAYQFARVDGELIMISSETGKFYALKDVGLYVWERLDTQPHLSRLCDQLAQEYDAADDTIRPAIQSFIDDLLALGFIEAA